MTTKVILLRFLTYTITFGPMVTRIALIIICFLSIPIFSVSQQDAKLANHYYQSGEYENLPCSIRGCQSKTDLMITISVSI